MGQAFPKFKRSTHYVFHLRAITQREHTQPKSSYIVMFHAQSRLSMTEYCSMSYITLNCVWKSQLKSHPVLTGSLGLSSCAIRTTIYNLACCNHYATCRALPGICRWRNANLLRNKFPHLVVVSRLLYFHVYVVITNHFCHFNAWRAVRRWLRL